MATPALGGRFDQTIASINMLYMMKDQTERKFILVSDENLTMLLDKVNIYTVYILYLYITEKKKYRVHIKYIVS